MKSESWAAFALLFLFVVLEVHSGISELIIRLTDFLVAWLVYPWLTAPYSAQKSAYFIAMLLVTCLFAVIGAYLLFRVVARGAKDNFMLRSFARILAIFVVALVFLNAHRGGFFLIPVTVMTLFLLGTLLYFWASRHTSGVKVVLAGFWTGLIYLVVTAGLLLIGRESGFFLYQRNFHAQFGLLWLPFVLVYAVRHLQVLAEGSRQSFFRVSLWLILGFLLLAVSGMGHVLFGRQAFMNSTVLHYCGALLFCTFLGVHLYQNRKKIFFPQGRDVLILLPRKGFFLVACVFGAALPFVPLIRIADEPQISAVHLANPRTGLSAASTDGLGIHGEALSERKAPIGCGSMAGCHKIQSDEWATSAHALSANAAYRQAVQLLVREEGKAAARLCAGCHDPLPLLAGQITEQHEYPIARSEGITCAVCHSMEKTTDRNNQLRLKILQEERLKLRHYLTAYMMVKDDKAAHRKSWTPAGIKDAEFCKPCHSLTLNNVVIRDVYSEWETGPFGPRGANPTRCQDCHMPKQQTSYLGAFVPHDHRFLGGNVALPGSANKAESKVQSMKAKALRLNLVSTKNATTTVRVQVRLTNTGVGHDFPAGPRDLLEYWFEYRYAGSADESWKTLSGNLFAKELLDKNKTVLDQHQIWRTFHVNKGKSIKPGATVVFDYVIAAESKGTMEIRLMHRRFNGRFKGKDLEQSGLFVEPIEILRTQ